MNTTENRCMMVWPNILPQKYTAAGSGVIRMKVFQPWVRSCTSRMPSVIIDEPITLNADMDIR
ncbi:hypothetical protein D3C73_1268800 [compost metagenome]